MDRDLWLRFDWVDIPAGPALIGVDGPPLAGRSASPAPLVVDARATLRPPESRESPESPARTIVLPAYRVSRVPVTNAQYAAFVTASGHRPPAHWEGPIPPASLARHPVTCVDLRDARAFCAWAGVRLPTEAEWEKAARGTDRRPWPWGWDPPGPHRANFGGRIGGTTEVGAFPGGASPYGVLDMAGNVLEWTAGRAGQFADETEDQVGPGRQGLRGGAFGHGPDDVRCTAREALHGDACDEYIGFRVVAAGDGDVARPTTGAVRFDWVTVPAGPFEMGGRDAPRPAYASDLGPPTGEVRHRVVEDGERPPPTSVPERPGLGQPRHTVNLEAFAIARWPVTNAQYAAFVEAMGTRPPGHWEGPSPPHSLLGDPVTYVDWYEARAFCAWAGVRLPTEAEWERAAAGPDGRPFPWGDTDPGDATAWFGHPRDDVGTRAVTGRAAGASREGVHDLAGNVWEWTSSLHWPYPYRPDDGREDPRSLGRRVLRGGSFRSPGHDHLRCAFRSRSHPTRRRDHIGFRVLRIDPRADRSI